MPRQARQKSESKIYHVMIRGNEKKKIFYDDADKEKFIEILEKKNKNQDFKIYGYCLMDNHVHLLINEDHNEISRIMKGINVSYVHYFNKKYDRIGHLFQGRFKSEAISDEKYLLMAIRYVHNNPVKANIVKEPSQYEWSSYKLYINEKNEEVIEKELILSMFSDNESTAVELFKTFSEQENNDDFIDIEDMEDKNKRIKREVEKIIFKITSKKDITNIKEDKENRDKIIIELNESLGLSIRKIANILEVNRGTIYNSLKKNRDR